MRHVSRLAAVLIGLVSFAGLAVGGDGFVNLFNGTNLNGWIQRGGSATYNVVDGVLVGESVLGTENSFLCPPGEYGNFVLEYEFKVDSRLNSGVQIRSQSFGHPVTVTNLDGTVITVPANRVHGYQIEIDNDPARQRWWTAGLYEEGARGWIFPGFGGGDPAAFTQQGAVITLENDWNQVKVEAIGSHFRTWLNGQLRVDVLDSRIARGFFGFQVHTIGNDSTRVGAKVNWRNIRVMEINPRSVWQIGTNNNPAVLPYRPSAEFSAQNDLNDLRPGRVTRLPGDAQYVAGTNPGADDDFYFAGIYPAGFNGLPAVLNVPTDEPALAWERAHTLGDKTNRVHFVLDPAQVVSGASFRLTMEWVSGGLLVGGVLQPGFADHDMVVRFRNGSGAATTLFSQRVSQITNVVIDFPATAVAALAGANSLEIVRTGPGGSGLSYFIQYDHLRLEFLPALVNTPPVLATLPDLVVDELVPLSLSLSATDADLPAQTLTYSLVSGPVGLTVNAAGALTWTPAEHQGPGTHLVSVQVTDNGVPPLADTRQFNISVNEVANPLLRSVWQIGTNNNPAVLPYRPSAEFSAQNDLNDLRPGRVTRLPGDAQYVAGTNPGADDDFYFAGIYPAGFNGLPAVLNVPNDEPALAWERAHTLGDKTNRVHFVLDPAQVISGASFRLTMEWVSGGLLVGGVLQPGFADHDMVVRFRNGSGAATTLFSQRVSQITNVVIDFPAMTVAALAGANSLEIVRTGPGGSGLSYFIQYDHLLLESLSGGSGGLGLTRVVGVPKLGGPEIGGDAWETGPGSASTVHRGTISISGQEYLTLTYVRPDPAPTGVHYRVEASFDLVHWCAVDPVSVTGVCESAWCRVVVRDDVPLGSTYGRFLRLRIVPVDAGFEAQ